VLRGAVLVRDGEFVGSRTGGRFCPRTLLPEVVGPSADFGYTFRAESPADRV